MAIYTNILGLLMLLFLAPGMSNANEKRLTKHLIDNYRRIGRLGRPVESHNDTMDVNFGLSLIQVVDVDYSTQSIELLVWFNMQWTDIYMKWTPSDFGDVKNIRVEPRDIFIPDITAYNGASKMEIVTGDASLVLVQHTGLIYYIPGVKQRFSCRIPHPNDSNQRFTCPLKIGSWTYDGFLMDLKLSGKDVDTSNYMTHPEFDLVSTSAKRQAVHYPCCPEPYIDISFNITLQAKSGRQVRSNKINVEV